uniref:Uncharacterized protein n=1 Tax=Arundo donax TaxID=35708 RepID=A0A0A9FT60_ARUDO
MLVPLILYSTHSGLESSSSTIDILEAACLIYSLRITKYEMHHLVARSRCKQPKHFALKKTAKAF